MSCWNDRCYLISREQRPLRRAATGALRWRRVGESNSGGEHNILQSSLSPSFLSYERPPLVSALPFIIVATLLGYNSNKLLLRDPLRITRTWSGNRRVSSQYKTSAETSLWLWTQFDDVCNTAKQANTWPEKNPMIEYHK